MDKETIMFIICIPFFITYGILEILWFIKYFLGGGKSPMYCVKKDAIISD